MSKLLEISTCNRCPDYNDLAHLCRVLKKTTHGLILAGCPLKDSKPYKYKDFDEWWSQDLDADISRKAAFNAAREHKEG